MTTLLIDNYDSFTWNVYQSLSNLGAKVVVYRNDQLTIKQAVEINPRSLVISPGPGYPSKAGISNDLIKHFQGKIPILGVCLGEQAIYEIYGGKVVPCGELIHGKTTPVKHDGQGLFEGVSQNIECTRYHSLAGDLKTLPDDLKISAWVYSGIIMGVRHKKYVIEGVQFHPESIASEQGNKIFANFLSWSGGEWVNLERHPEWIVDSTSVLEVEQDVSNGIPLSKASKMNSTAQPQFLPSKSNDSILQKIHRKRQQDVEQEKLQTASSMAYLERSFALGLAPTLISFKQRLQHSISAHGVAVLAEVKRASPSKGDIDMQSHAPQQALLYASGGAAAISVLTEPNWFKGSLEDLKNVRQALQNIHNRPAVLRKEFIFDRYQILQARLAGADTILLIVAILDDNLLADLIAYSRTLGMEPLVEVANSEEMKKALAAGSQIIGVNNRDLNTFQVDMNRTNTLSELVSGDVILLALSGITCRADVETYIKSGAKGVLVGEALMRSTSKPGMVQDLLGVPHAILPSKTKSTMIKICGLTNVEDAMHAVDSGADLLGFIFANESPRYVGANKADEIISAIRKKFPAASTTRSDSLNHNPERAQAYFGNTELPTHRPLIVGVFTNQSAHEINSIASQCNLDLIQCHTERDPSFHRLLCRPVVQVIGIKKDRVDVKDKIEAVVGSCVAILLDTVTDVVGGTGATFDWDIVKTLEIPVWMAGGLTPDNVNKAVSLKPLVVDVCSGVEIQKGKKDHHKVSQFIKNAQ